MECVGGIADGIERQGRAFRDVDQPVMTIREVEYPQHCHLELRRCSAALAVVQSAPTKLGFALGVEIDVKVVVLEDLNDCQGVG